MKRAFTLIELLVVIAIIAVLAAILFPVFAQAKAAAKKTAALSNAKQGVLGFLLYAGDNEDRYPLALWTGTADPANDWNSYAAARPYFKSEAATFDPMDPTSAIQRENADELPAPTTEAQREFNVGMTSDFGINIQFINPIWFPDGVMAPSAITTTQVVRPANALFAVDSVWARVNGVPEGGGNWQIDAPCWTGADGKDLRPGWTSHTSYWWFLGWNPSRPLAWEVFGGVWPWHDGGRQAVVEFTDGHVKAVAMPALVAGCDVKDGSTGLVTDPEKFLWASTQ